MKNNNVNTHTAGSYQLALLNNKNNPLCSPANDMSLGMLCKNNINITQLEAITSYWVKENPLLRTVYNIYNNQLFFTTLPELAIAIAQYSVESFDEANLMIQSIIKKPIDISCELFRIMVFDISSQYTLLFFQWHHIAGDYFSVTYLLSQLVQLIASNKISSSSSSDTNYFNFIEWQENYLTTKLAGSHSDYWRNKIAAWKQKNLILSKPRFTNSTGFIQNFEFNQDETANIQLYCQRSAITPSQFFMAIYQAALCKSEINLPEYIMMPINTRPGSKFRNTIGYFVNFVPITFYAQPDVSFEALMQTIKNDLILSIQNSYYPFHLAIDDTCLYSEMMKLVYKFQSGIIPVTNDNLGFENWQRYGVKENITSLDDNLVSYPRAELSLIISHENQQFYGAFQYRSAIYSSNSILILQAAFKEIALQAIHSIKFNKSAS